MAEGTITSSIGTQVYLNDVYKLTNIQSIGELQGDPGQIDVTNLESKEYQYIPGAKQISALAIVCFKEGNNDGNYEYLLALAQAQRQHRSQLTRVLICFPDDTAIHFNARISVKLNAVPVNGAITFTLTLFKEGDLMDGLYTNYVHSSGSFESYDDVWQPRIINWTRYTDGRVRLEIAEDPLFAPFGGVEAGDSIIDDSMPVAIIPTHSQSYPHIVLKGDLAVPFTCLIEFNTNGVVTTNDFLGKVAAFGDGKEEIFLSIVYQGPIPA